MPDRLEYEPLTPILYDRMTRSVGEKSLIRKLLVGLLSQIHQSLLLACNRLRIGLFDTEFENVVSSKTSSDSSNVNMWEIRSAQSARPANDLESDMISSPVASQALFQYHDLIHKSHQS